MYFRLFKNFVLSDMNTNISIKLKFGVSPSLGSRAQLIKVGLGQKSESLTLQRCQCTKLGYIEVLVCSTLCTTTGTARRLQVVSRFRLPIHSSFFKYLLTKKMPSYTIWILCWSIFTTLISTRNGKYTTVKKIPQKSFCMHNV